MRASARIGSWLAMTGLVLALVAAPRPALAQSQASSEFPVIFLGFTLGAGLLTLGAGTDYLIGDDLGRTGHVRLLVSVTGTLAWTAVNAFMVSLFLSRPPANVVPALGFVGAVTLASLGWSIYGLTQSFPVTLTPVALRDASGATVPGLCVAARF